MRYELKLQLSTDLEIEKVEAVIRGLEKSGKVEVHWIHAQEAGPMGRPAEMRARVMAALESEDYPRSARQLSSTLKVAQSNLYRTLHLLVAEGVLLAVEDSRWRTKRYGLPDQVSKFKLREEKRIAKAEAILARQRAEKGFEEILKKEAGEEA